MIPYGRSGDSHAAGDVYMDVYALTSLGLSNVAQTICLVLSIINFP